MKTFFCDSEFAYDGKQLRSLFAYLKFQILGDSVVSWVGPCHIDFQNMVDGEDQLARSEIRGDRMVHFILEKFDTQLFSGVCLQRLMASLAIDLLREISPCQKETQELRRDGDDIFFREKKLSISVASQSPTSTVLHFAVNVINDGTPVATTCLNDFKVEPADFARRLCAKVQNEVESIVQATQKVHALN